MKTLIAVSEERCIACGLCARVCPVDIIGMENERPVQVRDSCVACGHCTAVCPTEAINNRLAPASKQRPRNTVLDCSQAQVAELLRSRRSIRWFHERPVEKSDMAKLLDMSRYAPSAANSQGVSYLVIQNKRLLRQISAACAEYMLIYFAAQGPEAVAEAECRFKKNSRDRVLLDAPCLFVTMSEKENTLRGRDSSVMAMMYLHLYAQTVGLGVCWAGVVEAAMAAKYEPLMDALQIPDQLQPTGAMMAGYPCYEFRRIPARNPLHVMWRD